MAAQTKIDMIRTQPNGQPQWEQSPKRVVKKRLERSPRKGFHSIKMLLVMSGIGVFGLMFMQLYLDSQINHINTQAEFTRMEIDRVLTRNEQLASQVAELSRHTRINAIATEHGLTFNDNIVRIAR